MGRSRIIKGDTFKSRSLAKCTPLARLTYIGLWTESDDAGRGIADARVLCGALWSLDEDITPAIVADHLAELAETGHIVIYAVDGDEFFAILNWEKHQAAAYRKGVPKYPDPYDESVSTILHASACKKVLEVKGKEVKGSISPSPSEPVAPLRAVASAKAEDDFDRFWEQYPRKVAKSDAHKAFRNIKPPRPTTDQLIAACAPLRSRPASEAQFIPHPASWLNKRRWEDEAPKADEFAPVFDPDTGAYLSVHAVRRSM